ncbi:MAG: methyl-accepting chemotaxis protein [Thermoguttaceae bacterium]
MNLFGKIFSIGCISIVLSFLTCGILVYTNLIVRDKMEEEANYRSFRTEIVDAQRAHLAWLRTIQNAMTNHDAEIKIVTDGKACQFGKWYYGDGAERVKVMTSGLQEKFSTIAPGHLAVHTMGSELQKRWNPNDTGSAIDYFRSVVTPAADKLLADLNAINTASLAEADRIQKESQWLLDNAMVPVWIVLGISIITTLLSTYLVAHGIVRDLKSGILLLDGLVKQGDLQANFPEKLMKRKDEIGAVGRSLEKVLQEFRQVEHLAEELSDGRWNVNISVKGPEDVMNLSLQKMVDGINAILGQVRQSVQIVETSASQIAVASTQVSSGSSHSAASVEEISAVMSGLSDNMRKVVETAHDTSRVVGGANEVAGEGQGLMKELLDSMRAITKTSETVKQVVKMIDDIAFQTNLLALNAAVEAARAGQHGKGFAVVAEEVRNLAARSAKAAKETADLIDQSTRQIETGAQLAGKTGQVLDKIVATQRNVSDLVDEIARSNQEQSEGVNQVTIGVRQIEDVTQKNAAGAEETSVESKNLTQQAGRLGQLVAQFTLRS